MVGLEWVMKSLQFQFLCFIIIIWKELMVWKLPKSKSKGEKRCELQLSENRFVKLCIIGWWHLVNVKEEHDLHQVHYEVGDASNWEEDWQSWPEHHGDECYVHDHWVPEMDQIFWTCVNIDVLLLRCTVSFFVASLIPLSFRKSESKKDTLQDDCEVTVEKHGANYGISRLFIPILVKVRLLSIKILE